MVVSVHPRLFPWPNCGDATVDMVVSGTPAFWEQHDRLGPAVVKRRRFGRSVLTQIAIGWDASTKISLPPGVKQPAAAGGSPALVVFFDDPQAPLHPGFYVNSDLTANKNAHQTKVTPYPSARPVGLLTQIYNWGYAPHHATGIQRDVHEWPLHLHFVANWVAPRGWGSCYVLLPSLLANGAFAGTQNALETLLPTHPTANELPLGLLAQAQPPSYGRIALAAKGSFSLADTSPAPTDFEAIFVGTHGSLGQRAGELAARSGGNLGPVWACQPSDDLSYLTAHAPRGVPGSGSFPGDACGAVAVVDAVGASDVRAIVLIVFGVLIALAFERFFQRLRVRDLQASAGDSKSEPQAPDETSPDGTS